MQKKNKNLFEFISHYNLKNFVTKPTRTKAKFYKRKKEFCTSSTIIDVIIHNNELINSTSVINCLFSDHDLITANVKVEHTTSTDKFIIKRDLSEKNLLLINEKLFISQLENILFMINQDEPIFIVGDLNMDLLAEKNKKILLNLYYIII